MAIGVRTDVVDGWSFPSPTHSREALVWSQHLSGDYWTRHDVPFEARQPLVAPGDRLVTQLRQQLLLPAERPWLTIRDAIGDLPEPTLAGSNVDGHRLHPGARTYPRHTGSRWDEPAKALKAGDHGVPGGENILVQTDGTVRYFTLREMARLQGLPDDFHVPGTWKAPIKQLGNAVPVGVGEVLGGRIGAIIAAGVDAMPVAA